MGCLLADRLREVALPCVTVVEHTGEPVSLMDAWQGLARVVLIDAVFSGGNAEAGTLYYFDLNSEKLPASFAKPTTHAFGIAEAVEFARVLGKLPEHIAFYGIEGQSYGSTDQLSDAVRRAADALLKRIVADLS